MQAELSAPPFTPDMEYRAWLLARFLQAHDVWDNRKFVTVTIKGQEFVVVDIGMRMLTPRELFNAQGFPPDYVIEGVWSLDTETGKWKFHAFTKNVQVSCCGNSVCPGLARALVAANCGHLAVAKQPASQVSTGYPPNHRRRYDFCTYSRRSKICNRRSGYPLAPLALRSRHILQDGPRGQNRKAPPLSRLLPGLFGRSNRRPLRQFKRLA